MRDLSDKAIEFLRLGRYEEVDRLIQDVQAAGPLAESAAMAQLIDVARATCQAYFDIQSNAARHREALSRIADREQELNLIFRAILDLLRGVSTEKGGEPISREPTLGRTIPESYDPAEVNRLSPRQRVRSFARRKKGWDERGRSSVEAGFGMPQALRNTHKPPASSPDLTVYCLGQFQVYFRDLLVEDWPNGKGKAIFKFLAKERERPIGKEILMDLFWSDFEPHAARNNLNVAIYGLRRALATVAGSCSIVLFRNDCYLLNPVLDTWVDCEAFTDYIEVASGLERQGHLPAAIEKYRSAEALYRGEFLEEDRYEDWPDPIRRNLQNDYLALVDRLSEWSFQQEDYGYCIYLCNKILGIDACHEESHRRAMKCWSKQGLPQLAMQQYHICQDVLQRELNLHPSQETERLLARIQRRERV